MGKIESYLAGAVGRLTEAAQQLELTQDQIAELQSEFERLMARFDLGPSELNLILGDIGGVVFFEQRLRWWNTD